MDTFTAPSPSFLGSHHLVHRPHSPEAFLLTATAPIRQDFALSAQLPDHRAPLDDSGPGYHDLAFPLESLRRTMLFAARRYFRVPAGRLPRVVSGSAAITDLDAWRHGGGRPGIALDLGMTPLDVVDGVPRGLEAEAAVSIDGRRCGTASARLLFPAGPPRPGRPAPGRGEGRASTAVRRGGPDAAGGHRPQRADHPGVREPHVGPAGRAEGGGGLVFPVRTGGAAEAPGVVPPTLFVAASRQVGRLAAAELCGFVPSYAVLSRWEASFPDPAEPGTPLRCTVRQATAGGGRADGRVSRDAEGRPVADLRLTFLQGSRVVARVSASVSQDC